MDLASFLVLLLVAAVIGALEQALAGYSLGGCLMSIVVGSVGAFLGRWLAAELSLPPIFTIVVAGNDFPLIWSVFGVGALRRADRGLDRPPLNAAAPVSVCRYRTVDRLVL